MDRAARELEIDRNYDYFQNHYSEFEKLHAGKFALLKNQCVVGFFASVTEAVAAGEEIARDGLFSVQKVEPDPVDLGFWSHV